MILVWWQEDHAVQPLSLANSSSLPSEKDSQTVADAKRSDLIVGHLHRHTSSIKLMLLNLWFLLHSFLVCGKGS